MKNIIVIILFSVMMLSCDNTLMDAYNDRWGSYAIGDTGPSGVGIVFYVTDGGLHGLEVAPVDQSTGTAWSNITDTLIGTTGTAIGTGSANTDAIIAQNGHTASAALICRNYRASEEGDWFLPSKDELKAIWDNLVDDGTGNNSGVGSFTGDFYWSSSEYSDIHAVSYVFGNANEWNNFKSDSVEKVRAVRAF